MTDDTVPLHGPASPAPFGAAMEAAVCVIVFGNRRHGLAAPNTAANKRKQTSMDEHFWDELHSGHTGWSGNANPVLVQQVSALIPGRALDVGCGQGDDARWLAQRGWTVTASDISSVALERAASLTGDESVTWVHADHLTVAPPPQSYDLVAMHFFAIPKVGGAGAVAGLAEAVAPGGVLLVVQHPAEGAATWRGIDPHDFLQPHDIAGMLGDGWRIEIDEIRGRTTAPPEGSHHTHDAILRARRR
ncbi:MAG: class I SAM-dependent methyltransferase [Rhodococcus sp. (in: high G+C Gram-positive bacteria)]